MRSAHAYKYHATAIASAQNRRDIDLCIAAEILGRCRGKEHHLCAQLAAAPRYGRNVDSDARGGDKVDRQKRLRSDCGAEHHIQVDRTRQASVEAIVAGFDVTIK